MLNIRSCLFIVALVALGLMVSGCDAQSSPADETAGFTEPVVDDSQDEETVFSRIAYFFTTPKVTVPAGTQLTIRLNQALDSGQSQAGEEFTGTLVENLRVNDTLVVPAGTVFTGRVTHVDDADKVKGRGELTIQLTSVTLDHESYSISTHPLHFKSDGTKKEDAAVIGGAAGVGAAIGALTGGKKGAAIGAAAGGGAGTAYVLSTSGKEVKLPVETKLVFTLDNSVQLPESQ